jgi:hypothetical protein
MLPPIILRLRILLRLVLFLKLAVLALALSVGVEPGDGDDGLGVVFPFHSQQINPYRVLEDNSGSHCICA